MFFQLILCLLLFPAPKDKNFVRLEEDLQGEWAASWGDTKQTFFFEDGKYWSPGFGGGDFSIGGDGLVDFCENRTWWEMRLWRDGDGWVGFGSLKSGGNLLPVRLKRPKK